MQLVLPNSLVRGTSIIRVLALDIDIQHSTIPVLERVRSMVPTPQLAPEFYWRVPVIVSHAC
jgi:hypothetical protein